MLLLLQVLLPVLFCLGALAVADLVASAKYSDPPCRVLSLPSQHYNYVSGRDVAGDYRTGALAYFEAAIAEIGNRTETSSIGKLVDVASAM
jgi:hypothetical protein